MASREVRVVIAGCGGMGNLHASAWRKIEGVRIVGCCDTRAAAAKAFAERFDVSRAAGFIPRGFLTFLGGYGEANKTPFLAWASARHECRGSGRAQVAL